MCPEGGAGNVGNVARGVALHGSLVVSLLMRVDQQADLFVTILDCY